MRSVTFFDGFALERRVGRRAARARRRLRTGGRAAARAPAHAHDLAPGGAAAGARGLHGRLPGPARLRASRGREPTGLLQAGDGGDDRGADARARHERYRGRRPRSRLLRRAPARGRHDVSRLVVLDGVPIAEALDALRRALRRGWWHWFFFAQTAKPAEAIISRDPMAWYRGDPAAMGAENHADWRRAVTDPAVVRAMVADYRAGLRCRPLRRGRRPRGGPARRRARRCSRGRRTTTWRSSTATRSRSGGRGSTGRCAARGSTPATTWPRRRPEQLAERAGGVPVVTDARVTVLKALAHPLRLRIVDRLGHRGPAPVSRLAAELGASLPELSNGPAPAARGARGRRRARGPRGRLRARAGGVDRLLPLLDRSSARARRAAPARGGPSRTCYDHLAGPLGVSLYRGLLARGALVAADDGTVSVRRPDALAAFGSMCRGSCLAADGSRSSASTPPSTPRTSPARSATHSPPHCSSAGGSRGSAMGARWS